MSANPSLMSNFVKALTYYQTMSGKSKKEVADAIGVPPTTYSSWSNGKHLPDMDKLQNLSLCLKAPIDQFFNFTAISKSPDPLLQEMVEIYSKLPNEDKLLLRSVALRLLQLRGEQ
jgi:transcriptional regulator with XRE-family HTH domain